MPKEGLLVCVDGSKHSEQAVEYAVDIAKRSGSTITLMFVWTPPASAEQEMGVPESVPAHELERLMGARKILEGAEVSHRLVTVIGNPVDEILDEAPNYEMVIMGSRGLGGMERFILGSVTSKVSHRIRVPLMIVPPKREGALTRTTEAVKIP
jgi:nucleotide-binding universal stress UspA family protein